MYGPRERDSLFRDAEFVGERFFRHSVGRQRIDVLAARSVSDAAHPRVKMEHGVGARCEFPLVEGAHEDNDGVGKGEQGKL